MTRSMVMVGMFGRMVEFMKDNGLMGNKVEKANTYYQLELKEKVTGKMARESVGKMNLNLQINDRN
jgi:hypothetical protein